MRLRELLVSEGDHGIGHANADLMRALADEIGNTPYGLLPGLPKLVLSLCSQTPLYDLSLILITFGIQENPRARDHLF